MALNRIFRTVIVALAAMGFGAAANAGEVEDRLKPILEKLGYAEGKLPVPKPAMGSYVDAIQVGKILYLSSAGPQTPAGEFVKGRVPDQVNMEAAETAVQLACVRQLARMKVALGDLEQVKRIVFLRVKVRTVEAFNDLTKLSDGCSSMLVTAFGDAGKHTRTGEGYVALPFGLTAEIEMTVELK